MSRLGWSHGDDEIFSREQIVQWFDGTHLSKSPAQWDPAKLEWVNGQYLKAADPQRLAALLRPRLTALNIDVAPSAPLAEMAALYRDRCSTLVQLAEALRMFFEPVQASQEDRDKHLTPAALEACAALATALNDSEWTPEAINACFKRVLSERGLKMPQLAIPVRLLVCGKAQTPSVDAVLALFDKKIVVDRLQ